MTEYHNAPHTLDPTKEPPEPEEAVLAAGHNEEQAERVAELAAEYKQAVTEAEESARERAENDVPEPPYAPGHHAGEPPEAQDDLQVARIDETPEGEPQVEGSEVPDGTVADVLDWVGDDSARAQQALDAERAGQNRTTLISELEERV